MVINIRHFIITIISIFLSLGVGIFLGAIMDSQQLFIQQQNELVAQIEEDFNDFKEKNDELLNEIDKIENEKKVYDEFTNDIYKLLTDDKLNGLKIMLLKINTESDFREINKIVKEAGVDTLVELSIKNGNYIDKEDIKQYITNNLNKKNPVDLVILTFDNYIDTNIVGVLKEIDIPVIGVLKSNKKDLEISNHDELKIKIFTNVDNKFERINFLLYLINMKYEIKNALNDEDTVKNKYKY